MTTMVPAVAAVGARIVIVEMHIQYGFVKNVKTSEGYNLHIYIEPGEDFKVEVPYNQ